MLRWLALAVVVLLALSSGLAHAQDSPRSRIEGLDSLTAASLLRALDYLAIQPAELGFDKLYAEDDTFRLGIVEELLGDPLRIPGWQNSAVRRIRAQHDHPMALAGLLGELAEAPDDQHLPEGSFAAFAGAGAEIGEPAGSEAGDPALGGARLTPQQAANALIEDCRTAARALEEAFGKLSAEQRQTLLIQAPAMWGDPEEDPVDRALKGQLHFELGAPADTSVEITEDTVLDLAVALDRPALTRAARLFLAALERHSAVILAPADPSAQITLVGVTGPVSAVHETPWGQLVVGGEGNNAYSPEALERIAFLFEPGGDDIYRGRAASAIGELTRPLAALVDLSGNDFYDAGARPYVLGGAVLGVAALVDLTGDDVYRGGDGSSGAGCFGAGFLYDGGGADLFAGRNLCQGAAAFGLGALVSAASAEAPPGPELQPDRAFAAGLVGVPGTGAMPIRYDENDTYLCARFSQGFASTFGVGLLYDRAGNDTYRSGGHYLHAPLLPHDFQSLSQGYSIGFRPRAAGGIGILADEAGNDFYAAEVYAQGVSYWYSIGLLFDGAGNDRYLATQYAQGAGVHLAVGSLWDRGGDDHYVAKFGVTQGTAHDLSAGWLLDEGGNDYYVVSDGQGISITNSASIFVDSQGDDFYATPGGGQGKVTWARDFCGAGLFLDLEGRDTYAADAPGADGAIWSQDLHSLGIDLDRDVELPGEVVPEIELTAEDSARTVEELFETASIWEVGSAREKVRRARKALETKGIAAVDYVVAEKLGTRSGLEYRAILALARAYPDSFAARVLRHLEDDRERVVRNVIGLLGELERGEAREPMAAMLREHRYERHWTRIISALGRIGAPESRADLRPFLRDEEERRRIFTVAALATLSDTASVPTLVELLGDPQLTVRAAAHRALRSFGTAAVPALATHLEADPPQRAVVVRTLGRIAVGLRDSTDAASLQARAQARRMLMEDLDRDDASGDPASRAACVAALMELGDTATLAFVALRMEDESDPLVRRTYELARRASP